MSRLSQSQLERHVELLATNGKNANAQAAISKVGYTPAKLDAGAALLQVVRQGHVNMPAKLQAQAEATRAEALARQAAQKEMSSLAETNRTLFANDAPALTALGLLTEHQTVTNPDGTTTTVAVRPSEATAEVLSRWRTRLDALDRLDAERRAKLTEAGWPVERAMAAKALVEAYAQADVDQQVAIQAHKAAADKQSADMDALRAWYSTAAALCKRAIKDADPDDHQSLMSLLGL